MQEKGAPNGPNIQRKRKTYITCVVLNVILQTKVIDSCDCLGPRTTNGVDQLKLVPYENKLLTAQMQIVSQ